MKKYTPWTEDEEIYIEHYVYDDEVRDYGDASEFLGRTHAAISQRLIEMRKRDKNVGYIKKPWLQKEDELIRGYYIRLPVESIAERLGRSVQSVRRRASRLGVNKENNISDYDAQIRDLAAQGCYNKEIAEKLGLNPSSVFQYTSRHGIECQLAPKEVTQRHFRDEEKLRWMKIKERNRINGTNNTLQ